MSSTEPPKIEFPCRYPIKAIGDNGADFKALVITTVKQFAPDLNEQHIELNASRNGNFVSVRFVIQATGIEQLQSLHAALIATGRVKMVI